MFKGGSFWGGLVSGGVSQVQDTRSLSNGQMDRSQYAVKTSENVTGAIGVMAGIEYGAMLGTTIMPGAGTVLGSIFGGMLGNTVGRRVGNEAGKVLVHNRITQGVAQGVTQVSQGVTQVTQGVTETLDKAL
jgi:outer membrane lipoprotein SlyB